MISTAYKEKKKKATPPPRTAIHAIICLILDISVNSKKHIIESTQSLMNQDQNYRVHKFMNFEWHVLKMNNVKTDYP
jgi:hypothetical protein